MNEKPLTKEEWEHYVTAVRRFDTLAKENFMHSQIVAYVQDLEQQLTEKDVAIAAQAAALHRYGHHDPGCRFDVSQGKVIACRCGLHAAYSTDAVQKAVARLRELERIEQIYYHPDEHGLIGLAETETEARLAVATGLLTRWLKADGGIQPLGLDTEAFLADPSQAAAQYRKALAVVERVKDTRLMYVLLYGPGAINDTQMQATKNFQAALLGEEKS